VKKLKFRNKGHNLPLITNQNINPQSTMESKDTNNFTQEEFEKKYQEEYESFAQEMGKCNAMVLGLTGVGKSTLINAVFGFSTAKTGTGRPVTNEIREHSHPNSPINIYDTPGLEADGEKIKRTKEAVSKLIINKQHEDPKNHIHFIWYCINNKSNRIQPAEEEWIKDLVKQGVPVIIVLTQTFNPKGSQLLDFIKGLNLEVNDMIPVLAEPQQITDDVTISSHGVDKLIKVTAQLFPEALNSAKRAFIAAQKSNVDLKISEAEKCLKGYVVGAGAAGSPISGFFGGFAVAATQTAMIAHLTRICGLNFNFTVLFPIYIGCAAVSIPTLMAVSIPGLDYAGAPAAAIMTYCIGKAVLFGYEQYLNGQIMIYELKEIIINRFKKISKEGIKE
jgi:GTPase Era involved in 16S rRNA processing